jgi:methylamine---glutamate N-methyltransferase subunit C
MRNKIKLCSMNGLEDKKPVQKIVNNLDLVVIKYDDTVSVLYGRCLHRGALMADGHVGR